MTDQVVTERAPSDVVSTASDGRRMLRIEARNAETPIERKPPWIKTTAAHRAGVHRSCTGWCSARACTPCARRPAAPTSTNAGRTARPPSSSAAIQCTRRCDFCQIDTGAPGPARRRRATSRRASPSPPWACGTPPSPASPATTCPTAAPGSTPRPSARSTRSTPGTGVELLIPDFTGTPEQLDRGLRRRARGARAQPRDGAAHLQRHPAGVPLRPLPRRHHRRPAPPGWSPSPTSSSAWASSLDEVAQATARPARRRLRPAHDHAVPAAEPAPPPGRALGQARGVRRLCAEEADRIGFAGVMSGPLVRSSYRAGRLYQQALEARASGSGTAAIVTGGAQA